MKVFDIVRIVGPTSNTSYPRNSRTLVDHHDNEDFARQQCDLYNHYRNSDGYKYVVEGHDELSPDRAMPEKPAWPIDSR